MYLWVCWCLLKSLMDAGINEWMNNFSLIILQSYSCFCVSPLEGSITLSRSVCNVMWFLTSLTFLFLLLSWSWVTEESPEFILESQSADQHQRPERRVHSAASGPIPQSPGFSGGSGELRSARLAPPEEQQPQSGDSDGRACDLSL